MDAFPYVSGLTSVILALGLARILVGVGRLFERRHQLRLYWVHLLWSANVFLYITLQWWILFLWQAQQAWSFFLFAFLLATPTVLFLLSVVLFHDPLHENTDFKQHYCENSRWFFGLAALIPPLDLVDTTLKGYAHLQAQGPIYIFTIVLMTSMSVVAAASKNENYHRFFSVFFLVYILAFISLNLNVLQ